MPQHTDGPERTEAVTLPVTRAGGGPAVGGAELVTDLGVRLADGTRLSGDLRRPVGQGAVPVLVSYYPYRKDDIIGSLFEGTRARLCERGYATLFVDMAGTGASEGRRSREPDGQAAAPGGHGPAPDGESFDLPLEGRDCAEVIEWTARQDWCDGNVGAWGVSYGGMTALAAAAHRPPHLRAIMAAYATTDMYRDTIAPGGCPGMLGRYAWAAHMIALGLCPPTLQDTGGRWRDIWYQRLRRIAAGRPHAVKWQAHPERDQYWESRVVDASAIEVPTMLVGGWADAYSDAMIGVFSLVRGPRRLVLGPWMHVLPHLSDVQPFDWVAAMADWWDTHLRPRPPAAGPAADDAVPPVLFFAGGPCSGRDLDAGGLGGWRSARQWPPEGGTRLDLFLDGYRLGERAPAQTGSRDYQGDPVVGTAAGIWDPFGTGNGWPEEQSGDDAASLTFTSDPLAEPVLIAGPPQAHLYISLPSADAAQLVARLSMVGADGRSTLITAGWLRVPPDAGASATGIDTGRGTATGTGTGRGIDTGTVTDPADPSAAVTITLGSAAFAVPAGARLRLSVACAHFPHLWPTASNPALVVCFGSDHASVLQVPISGAAGHEPAAIPAPPPGQDTGWVTSGEPVYRVSRDLAVGETEVTFGASSGLAPPSGARLSLAETFTARVRASRPDGASLLARVDVGVRMPAGERIEVSVRSVAQRQSSVIDASVTVDGASLLRQRWASASPVPPPGPRNPPDSGTRS